MVVIMFPKKYEPNITRALDSVTHLLIRYFTGIVAESSIMTLIVSLGLLMLGFSVHNALVIGLIVGVLNVIPYLGPWDRRGSGYFHRCGRNCGRRRVDGRVLRMRVAGNDSGRSGYRQLRSATGALLQSGESAIRSKFFSVIRHCLDRWPACSVCCWPSPAYNVIRVFAKEFFNNFRVVQKLTEKI